MRAKLQAIKQELRRKMHEPVAEVGAWLKRVVDGYYRYHAVPGNLAVLGRFRERLCRYWRHVLRRRSQRRKPDWEQLRPIFDRWISRPRTLHPYIPMFASTLESKRGAVCGNSASTDLCGG